MAQIKQINTFGYKCTLHSILDEKLILIVQSIVTVQLYLSFLHLTTQLLKS